MSGRTLAERYGRLTGRIVKLLRAATHLHKARIGLHDDDPRAQELTQASAYIAELIQDAEAGRN